MRYPSREEEYLFKEMGKHQDQRVFFPGIVLPLPLNLQNYLFCYLIHSPPVFLVMLWCSFAAGTHFGTNSQADIVSCFLSEWWLCNQHCLYVSQMLSSWFIIAAGHNAKENLTSYSSGIYKFTSVSEWWIGNIWLEEVYYSRLGINFF